MIHSINRFSTTSRSLGGRRCWILWNHLQVLGRWDPKDSIRTPVTQSCSCKGWYNNCSWTIYWIIWSPWSDWNPRWWWRWFGGPWGCIPRASWEGSCLRRSLLFRGRFPTIWQHRRHAFGWEATQDSSSGVPRQGICWLVNVCRVSNCSSKVPCFHRESAYSHSKFMMLISSLLVFLAKTSSRPKASDRKGKSQKERRCCWKGSCKGSSCTKGRWASWYQEHASI